MTTSPPAPLHEWRGGNDDDRGGLTPGPSPCATFGRWGRGVKGERLGGVATQDVVLPLFQPVKRAQRAQAGRGGWGVRQP